MKLEIRHFLNDSIWISASKVAGTLRRTQYETSMLRSINFMFNHKRLHKISDKTCFSHLRLNGKKKNSNKKNWRTFFSFLCLTIMKYLWKSFLSFVVICKWKTRWYIWKAFGNVFIVDEARPCKFTQRSASGLMFSRRRSSNHCPTFVTILASRDDNEALISSPFCSLTHIKKSFCCMILEWTKSQSKDLKRFFISTNPSVINDF